MKSKLLAIVFLTLVGLHANAQVENFGFEEGDFSGWTQETGVVNYNINTNTFGDTTVDNTAREDQFEILSPQSPVLHEYFTLCGDTTVTTVYQPGSYSLRLGNIDGGNRYAKISRTFTVTADLTYLSYQYSLVLEDPAHDHTEEQKPKFVVTIRDSDGKIIPDRICGSFEVYAGDQANDFGFNSDCVYPARYTCTFPESDCGQDPGLFAYDDDIKQLLPWTSSGADLSEFVGQEITIEFMTIDCMKSGHGIMAFIDASLEPLEIDVVGFCNETIGALNETTFIAPDGFKEYIWKLNTSPDTLGTEQTIQLSNITLGDSITVIITPFTGSTCADSISRVLGPVEDVILEPLPDTIICQGQQLTITPEGENVGSYLFLPEFTPDTAMYAIISPDVDSEYRVSALDENGCPSGDTVVFNVEVIPNPEDHPALPEADFEIVTGDNCTDLELVNNSGYCRGDLSYFWDFGDGSTSEEFEPTKYYDPRVSATYEITLTVTSIDDPSLTDSQTRYFDASSVLDPNFRLDSIRCGIAYFTNLSELCGVNFSENPNFYHVWNFGDGGSDTTTHEEQTVEHLYNVSDVYDISLTLVNDQDPADVITAEITESINIVVEDTAGFTFRNSCNEIRFTDVSSFCNPITSWKWTFNDPGVSDGSDISDVQNPTYVYQSIDTAVVVTLEVSDGTTTETYSEEVNLIEHLVFNFAHEHQGCGLVRFSNEETPCNSLPWLKFIWNFGDNTPQDTLVGQSFVEHNYPQDTSGSFPVTLTILDSISGFAITPPIDPIEISTYDSARLSYEINDCRMVVFEDQSVFCKNIASLEWDFGDGTTSSQQNPTKVYDYFDSFKTVLTVTDEDGKVLKDSVIIDITDQFTVAISAEELECGEVELTNPTECTSPSVKYIWNFDDGNTLITPSSQSTVQHKYLQSGNFEPFITAIDTVSNLSRTIAASTLEIRRNDFSFFTYTTDCKTAMFADSSVFCNDIISWEWDFGDGSPTVSEQNPTHSYAEYGTYAVTLTVTDGEITRANTLNVEVDNTLAPQFSVIDEGCATFTFIDRSVHCDPYTRIWTFGDGETSSDSIVTHQYKSNVEFNVTLVISNNGTSEQITHPVSVEDILAPLSPVDLIGCAGPDTTYAEFVFEPLQTDTITYLFNDAEDDRIVLSYFKTLADAESNMNELNVSPTYDSEPGTVFVRVTDSKYGEYCYELDSFNIAVHNSAKMDYIKNIELCNPNETSRLYPLEDMKAEVFNKLDKTDVTISFHASLEDANNNEFEISEIEIDTQVDAVVYVRVENVLTPNCASVYSFTIRLNEIYLDEYDETCPIDIANALSPNEDGMNDTFYISGLQFYANNELKIFNRWGNLVYEASRYENDWGGTFKGEMLPMAAYYYVLDLGNNKTYSGTVSIIR